MIISEAVLSMMKNPTEKEIKEHEERVEQALRGVALTDIRKSLGVSQEIFGVILGISEEEVEDLELNGIDADKLQEIKEFFGR